MIVNDSFKCVIMVSWKKAFLFSPSLSLIKALPFSRYPPFGKGLRNYKAVRRKNLSAFFNKSIEIYLKVCYTIMAFEENKHPRDKDGKFTSKGNEGDKEYRQNTDYKQILENKYNSDLPSKPKKYPRPKELTSKVMYLYSSNRKEIEKYGSVTTKIHTIEYIYTVEIMGFAGGYKILSRRKNK